MPGPTKIYFPRLGVTDQAPYTDTPSLYTRVGDTLNVRLRDVNRKAPRGGQRPGTRSLWNTAVCAGMAIQAMAPISTAAEITGYDTGAITNLTDFESRSSGLLTGLCWMLGATPSMFRDFDVVSTPATACYACRWHPLLTNDIRRACFGTFIDPGGLNGGVTTSQIKMVDELGVTLWSAILEDKQVGGALPGSPRHLYLNHIEISAPSLGNAVVIVSCQADTGTGNVEGYIYVYKASDGTYLKRYNCAGYACEVQQTVTRTDGRIASLFFGSGGAGSTTSHTITAGGCANHFRSGIMLWKVRTLTDGTLDTTEPLEQEAFGPALTAGNDFYEGNHGTWRFSEHLARSPRGCYPTAIAAGPDSSLVVTFSNAGWGPNPGIAQFQPNADNGAYSTVAMIDQTGTLLWERDTDSILRAYTGPWGTYYCDIPDSGNAFGSKPPSLFAAAVAADGSVYVGGARNSSSSSPETGDNLFRLDPIDGTILWRTGVGGAASSFSGGVAQCGLAVDPTDGNIVVAGVRSSKWGKVTTNPAAHLWKFAAANGTNLWHFDLYNGDAGDTDAAAAHAQCVDVDSRGRIIYGSDRITA